MSSTAMRDLNVIPPSELDPATKQDLNPIAKTLISNNLKSNSKSNETTETLTNGSETGSIDIEYIESENLTEIADVDSCLSAIMERLDSKDWVTICEALNNVRQISIFHKEKLLDLLEKTVPLVVKSVKNPRSAVCKTGIMTCSDIFKGYGDLIVDSLDPLLVQLFLKSSQDKKFVCEAADKALISMTNFVGPTLLLPKLQPYLKHKNPRIRAKASFCFSRTVPQLGIEGIKSYGIENLIQIAATQLSDQLPESRESARALALELQAFYLQSQESPDPNPNPNPNSWEEFCNAKLSPLSAQAILRVTSS